MGNEINYIVPGIAGVLVHVLNKMDSTMKKKKGNFSYRIFFNAIWPSVMINTIFVCLGNYVSHQIPDIANGNVWAGIVSFFTFGYSGQSFIHKWVRPLWDKLDVKDDAAKVLPLLLLPLLLASCVNERNFKKFHAKKPEVAIANCAVWAPVKASTITKVVTKPGKPVTVKGETKYVTVNCDSAYKAALDEAARLGQKGQLVVPGVKVPVPPSTERVDTVFVEVTRVEENTALVMTLQNKLAWWKKFGTGTGMALAILLVAGGVYGYMRLKGSYSNTGKNMPS